MQTARTSFCQVRTFERGLIVSRGVFLPSDVVIFSFNINPAVGSSNVFPNFHLARASAQFNLAPCTPESGGSTQLVRDTSLPDKKRLFKAHGFLAAIAWGILAPIAVGNSLGRHLIPKAGLWFQIHRALNVLVLIMTIIAFAIVVTAVQKSRKDPRHFEPAPGVINKHRTVGLVVFLLAIIQVIGGVMRPRLPEKDEDGKLKESKSYVRKIWESVHKLSGFGLLAMAWYQVHSGLVRYSQIFQTDKDHTNVFWSIVGVIGGVSLVGRLTRIIFPHSEESHILDSDIPAEKSHPKGVEHEEMIGT